MSHEELLAKVPLFGNLAEDEVAQLAARTREATFPEETTIVTIGEPGRTLFVILEGTVQVLYPARSQDLELARLGPGDFFGEMALLNDEPRSATVRSLDEVRLLILEKEEFRDLLEGSGRLALHILEALSIRIRSTDEQIGGLSEQVLRDHLTGLLNRRAFHERVAEETNRAQRYGERFSLLLMDVDRFKAVNDTFGHAAGDEVLRWIGRILSEHTRAADTPFRIGGEEFAILAPTAAPEVAESVADRLRTVIAEARPPLGQKLHITVSMGYATCPDHSNQGEGLFQLADEALLRAKAEGRNRTSGPGLAADGAAVPPS